MLIIHCMFSSFFLFFWVLEFKKKEMIACSSGTSAGERKLMPTIEEEMDRRQLLYNLLMPVMNMYVCVSSTFKSS